MMNNLITELKEYFDNKSMIAKWIVSNIENDKQSVINLLKEEKKTVITQQLIRKVLDYK